MRARLWLIVPLALGCQSKSAPLGLTVPPEVGWLLAVYRSGDGSAVAASALASAAEVVELEVDDLPAPRLSILGFRPAQLEGLLTDASACGRFRPALAGDPILPEPAWVSSFKRSSDRFAPVVEPLGPVELTAACLPPCPPRLTGLSFDVSCAQGSCRALPEQHQCTLDVVLDGPCAGATASFTIGGRGALSPIGACAPLTSAPDALVSVGCAAPSGLRCELSIYPEEQRPRIETLEQAYNNDTNYVGLAVASDLVIFSRPYREGGPRFDPQRSQFAFVEPERLAIIKDRPAPPCADHLLAAENGHAFYATSCSTVSLGRYQVGLFDLNAAPMGAAPLSSVVSEVRGLALAGGKLLIAAEAGAGDGLIEVREPQGLDLLRAVVLPGRGGTAGMPAAIGGMGDDRAVALDARLAHLVAFNPLDGSIEPPVPIDVTLTATAGVLVSDAATVTVGIGPFIQRFGGRPLVPLGPPRRPFAFPAGPVTALSLIHHDVVLGAWGIGSSSLAVTEGGYLRLGAYGAQFGPIIGGAVDSKGRAWFTVVGGRRYLRATVVAP